MLAAFPIKLAAVCAQVLFELGALQASTISSRRVGSCSFSASSRFASNTICSASFKFSRASSKSLALGVNPWNFLYPGSPPVTHLLVRRGQLHAHIFIGFGLLVQSLAANEIAQKRLDEFVIYNLPIAFKSGNTTVLFPSAISGLYAKSVAVQEQTNADFLISFTPGNYYFTIRALKPEAKDHLTVIYNRKAYVLRLSASEKPFYAVTFFQDARPRGAARPVIPERLLSLLDKAKAYPLFQKELSGCARRRPPRHAKHDQLL